MSFPLSNNIPSTATFRSAHVKRITLLVIAAALLIGVFAGPARAQQEEDAPPYPVGNPLGMPASPAADEAFEQISSNVTVYGAVVSAESCTYDAEREVIVALNRGVPQRVRTNDAWVSLINHDGSVHTPRWIGIQRPSERADLSPPLTLNEPLGSDISGGVLYVADRDGGTSDGEPTTAVIRRFDLETGTPLEDIRIADAPWINDLAVTEDGTIYTTQTGDLGPNPDPQTWKVWEITPGGKASVFAEGTPINQPNGIALDPDGNIVVANFGNTDVLTFSPDGELLTTESAVQPGSDGLVIMPDGTKYVSSVSDGGVSRIRPGEPAELIAQNIPSAASMCYDSGANQLVIPMTSQNTLAFIPLD